MTKMDPSLIQRAQALINRLHNGHNEKYGFGSMSCAIYDSAWVSQISKVEGGVRKWLFPQCFLYILANQKQDGSWESYSSEIDGILNTAASLLAVWLTNTRSRRIKITIRDVIRSVSELLK